MTPSPNLLIYLVVGPVVTPEELHATWRKRDPQVQALTWNPEWIRGIEEGQIIQSAENWKQT